MWWCAPAAPALAQSVAGPPEVTVDLSVLNSLDREPPHHRAAAPRERREPSRAAAPQHKTHTAAKKPKAPTKKAAAKPAHPTKRAAATEAPRTAKRDVERDDAERAARDEAIWEADRKREETDRKRAETDRYKREEAERMRQAKAEIEEAARNAARPAKTSENILEPGEGPATPPAPAVPPQTAQKPATPTGQVAAAAPPAPSPQPTQPPPSAAPTPTPPPARAKPAAVEMAAGAAPHIDFTVGTADLSAGARAELDALAKKLNADQDERVQLVAYATGTADEANQARRLSLSRALNVRAYLIDHGVRNTRMDVRALGNRPDGDKPADRVEILFLK